LNSLAFDFQAGKSSFLSGDGDLLRYVDFGSREISAIERAVLLISIATGVADGHRRGIHGQGSQFKRRLPTLLMLLIYIQENIEEEHRRLLLELVCTYWNGDIEFLLSEHEPYGDYQLLEWAALEKNIHFRAVLERLGQLNIESIDVLKRYTMSNNGPPDENWLNPLDDMFELLNRTVMNIGLLREPAGITS
jgi:hypothetical protein